MTLKKSLPLPKEYLDELAYWVTRISQLGRLNRDGRIRIIQAAKGVKING